MADLFATPGMGRENQVCEPISISLVWPILTFSPLFEKQRISHCLELELTKTRFRKFKDPISKYKNQLWNIRSFSMSNYISYIFILCCGPHSRTSLWPGWKHFFLNRAVRTCLRRYLRTPLRTRLYPFAE